MSPANNAPSHFTTPLRRGFLLATKDLPRSRGSVTTTASLRALRACPKGRGPSGLSPLAGWQGCRGVKLPCFPALRVSASICIKGEGCRPPSSPGRRQAGAAASGVALDADSSIGNDLKSPPLFASCFPIFQTKFLLAQPGLTPIPIPRRDSLTY